MMIMMMMIMGIMREEAPSNFATLLYKVDLCGDDDALYVDADDHDDDDYNDHHINNNRWLKNCGKQSTRAAGPRRSSRFDSKLNY